MDHLALLSGAHPFHFPLYWEHASWIIHGHSNPGSWQHTPLENELLRRWRSLHESPTPIFKYVIGSDKEPLETKLIPGPLGLVAQKALGRAGKRKPPSVVTNVASSREKGIFDFGQVRVHEVIFAWRGSAGGIAPDDSLLELQNDLDLLISASGIDSHAVILNVAPFSSFHFLLVPTILEMLPQVLTLQGLRVALEFVINFSHFMCLLFNSQGAGASVNHLHWQGMYLRERLPIEKQSRNPLDFQRVESLRVEKILHWPITAWIFSSTKIDLLLSAAYPLIQALLDRNIAHNLLVRHIDGYVELFIMPRQLASFPDPTQVQIASTEAFGWWIHPDPDQFANFTEDEARERMSSVALDQPILQFVDEVVSQSLSAIGSSELDRSDL